MIRNVYVATVALSAPLGSSTTAIVAQIETPATRRCSLLELRISGASVTTSDPNIRVRLLRGTTGRVGGAAITPVATDTGTPAALATVVTGSTGTAFSTAPSGGTAVGIYLVPIVQSLVQLPFAVDSQVVAGVSSALALEVTTGSVALPAGTVFEIVFDE